MTPKAASYDALLAAATRASHPVTLSTGGVVELRGLSVVEIVRVLREFPELRDMLLNLIGAGSQPDDLDASTDLIRVAIDAGPEALSALLATAIGDGSNKELRAVLGSLPDDDFFSLLEAAVKLTMPEGLGGFFARFRGVAAAMGLLPAPSQSDVAA